MFPPVPKDQRSFVITGIVIIGVLVAILVYHLQTQEIEISAAVAGLLAAVLAFAQWFLAQVREDAKVRWEAVRAYYEQRDEGVMLEVAPEVFGGNLSRAHVYCNFFEKWGRLVQMGYLPHEIFDGSSGVHIVNAILKLEPFLVERRTRNRLYASSYLWLVASTVCKPEVRRHIDYQEVESVLRRLMRPSLRKAEAESVPPHERDNDIG